MRLIDAEHLKRWILSRWEKIAPRSEYPLKAIDIIDQIDREDTVEAEPVKHGHWIICSNVYSDGDYECSECHKREWNDTDYCPNCGAKMGEVKLTTSAEMNPEKYLKNLNEVKE